MKNTLENYLIEMIRAQGPISVAQFMAIALGHPQHGYYMKQDPFGRGGDFVTAPEISQMFGEIIGIWAADTWLKMDAPPALNFVECGPGRGTLMADMMRATKNVKGFHEACRIHLIEISPVLKNKQQETLAGYNVHWHDRIDALPQDAPVILIANEFLDALPIQQYVQTGEGWQERLISLDENDNFKFTPDTTGDIIEGAPARIFFIDQLCALLEKVNGAALFIDYGSTYAGTGDTLQAVHKHEMVDVFKNIGDADLTSHVDFEGLVANIDRNKINISGPVTQGQFLKNGGIEARAAQLSAKATQTQRADIENALQRLTASDQMGELFKVIGFSHGKALNPAGF